MLRSGRTSKTSASLCFTAIPSYRTLSNDDSDSLIFMRRWLELDETIVQLRSRYLPLFEDVLPGKKAATFFAARRTQHQDDQPGVRFLTPVAPRRASSTADHPPATPAD